MSLLGIVTAGEVAGPIADRLHPSQSPTGTAIGIGLVVFAVLSMTAFVWSLVDGHRRGVIGALLPWTAAAVVCAVGWLVWLGASAAHHDHISLAAGMALYTDAVLFDVGLVLAPAALGTVLGALSRSRRPHLR